MLRLYWQNQSESSSILVPPIDSVAISLRGDALDGLDELLLWPDESRSLMPLQGHHDPRESMDRLHVVMMLLLFLVVGVILGVVVLFLTDIFLGRLDDGVRLVDDLPRTPAAKDSPARGRRSPVLSGSPAAGSHPGLDGVEGVSTRGATTSYCVAV